MRNIQHAPFVVLLGLVALGCEVPVQPLPSTGPVTIPAPPGPYDCFAAGESCGTEQDFCCGGTFCDAGPYTPEAGRCVAQRPDGERCGTSLECLGGACNASGRCGPETCVALNDSCEDGGGCCAGSFCEHNVYLEHAGRCVPQLADDSFCSFDEECAAGHCTDGRCGPPNCAPSGSDCFGFEASCCAGLVCDLPADSYGPGQCRVKFQLGAPCEDASQCASERCAANRCAPPEHVENVSFSRIFDEVLVLNGCTGGYCHGGGAGGLWLSNADAAFRALVNARAIGPGCGTGSRVVPGELEASLMWRKVAPGVPTPCGSKMPPSRGTMPASHMALLEAWIRGGAIR